MTKNIKLYNTLTRREEIFKPLKGGVVGIYCCGPTVYDFAHIGNLRTYLFEDLLKRALLYNDLVIKHIMNITDVGHLTSDADTGEDKLEKGAQREQKSVWEIAEFYTKKFKRDLRTLNIIFPDKWIKATATIKEQIALIKLLEKKGFTYVIADGVYFNTALLKNYGVLWGNKKAVLLQAGSRVEMVEGKKNPTDFALWKLTPQGVKRQMEWPSPWGKGFPGWHTECVVMAKSALGCPFDIHCGGIDHIQIHHTNEIAQSQAAFGNNLANFWVHGEFLDLAGEKMSKSTGGFITLQTLIDKGFNPLAYRYLCLQTHYRKKLNFSFQSLKGAQNGLNNFYKIWNEVNSFHSGTSSPRSKPRSIRSNSLHDKFLKAINDDLNVPQALAIAWRVINDKALSPAKKYSLLLDFDRVFGLNLKEFTLKNKNLPKQKISKKVSKKVQVLTKQREVQRKVKNFSQADELRKQIEILGYEIEDAPQGPILKERSQK